MIWKCFKRTQFIGFPETLQTFLVTFFHAIPRLPSRFQHGSEVFCNCTRQLSPPTEKDHVYANKEHSPEKTSLQRIAGAGLAADAARLPDLPSGFCRNALTEQRLQRRRTSASPRTGPGLFSGVVWLPEHLTKRMLLFPDTRKRTLAVEGPEFRVFKLTPQGRATYTGMQATLVRLLLKMMRNAEGRNPAFEREKKGFLISGSPSRTRTSDPVVNSHLLYQLSYRGA
jgi:hypothetical protein